VTTSAAPTGWSLLLKYLAPHRRLFAGYALVLAVVTALEGIGLSLLVPILQSLASGGGDNDPFVRVLRQAFDALRLPYTFHVLLGVFTLIMLTKYFGIAYERHLIRTLSARVTYDLRLRSFQNLMELPLSYYYSTRIGDLIATQFSSTQNVGLIVEYGALIVGAAVLCVLYLTINAVISWPLTLTALAFGAISYGFILPRVRRGHGQGTEEKALVDQINTFLFDTLSGIKVVKVFNNESAHVQRYGHLIARYRQLLIDMLDNRVIASLFMEPLLFVLIVVMLLLSVELFALSLPSLIAFLFVFGQLLPRAKVIQSQQMVIMELLPHLRKVDALVTRRDKHYIPDGPHVIREINEAIVFDNVSFAYPGAARPALQNTSVTLRAGTTTALVGGSGGGKTTFVDLVLRLHDPTEGAIRVDGRTLTDFVVADWRRLIGTVEQDPYLFNDSIENNIRYGRPEATDEEVRRAARLAHADDFVERLPEGYRTVVGTRGITLSGGQRQRIALARALVRDPALLILDEATSALDSESERLIQEAVHDLKGAKTLLIIAHRLSTIRHADRILVIDEGRVIEEGTHEELMARSGRYHEYLTLQYHMAD
jgi:ABC-type multidrug transport system fused ATPase/permease subunit